MKDAFLVEQALDAQSKRSLVPPYPLRGLFARAEGFTNEQMFGFGYAFLINIDGEDFGVLNQRVMKNFLNNQPLHKKKLENIRILNPNINLDESLKSKISSVNRTNVAQ